MSRHAQSTVQRMAFSTIRPCSSKLSEILADLVTTSGYASSILHRFNIKHLLNLSHAITLMVDELVSKFKPTLEEEFLRIISGIFTDCLKHALAAMEAERFSSDHSTSSSLHNADQPIPQPIVLLINKCITDMFSSPNTVLLKYKDHFMRDFGTLSGLGLHACLRKLHEWRQRVVKAVERTPKVHRIEDLSRLLLNLPYLSSDIEVPGEHLELFS